MSEPVGAIAGSIYIGTPPEFFDAENGMSWPTIGSQGICALCASYIVYAQRALRNLSRHLQAAVAEGYQAALPELTVLAHPRRAMRCSVASGGLTSTVGAPARA